MNHTFFGMFMLDWTLGLNAFKNTINEIQYLITFYESCFHIALCIRRTTSFGRLC
jgi:hypothetical protein